MTILVQSQRDLRTTNGVTYYLGPRSSEYDRGCDEDNPFLKRKREQQASTVYGRVAAALDMPVFVYRVFPDGHEKRVQIQMRVQTPRGKGTIWQSLPERMGVLLDSNMSQVAFFEGEELAQIEPIYERIYDRPIFAEWLKAQ